MRLHAVCLPHCTALTGTICFEFSVSAALWWCACDVPAVWSAWGMWHCLEHPYCLQVLLSWEWGEALVLTEPLWSLLGLLWDSFRYTRSPRQSRWEPC